MRGAVIGTGAILALLDLRAEPGAMAATVLLLGYLGLRTLRPLPVDGQVQVSAVAVAVELGVGLTGAAISGGWNSPFVFTVLVGVLLAGFTYGYRGGLTAGGAASLSLVLAAVFIPSARAAPEAASQVTLVYAATGVLAGYARRLFLEAVAEKAAFAGQLSDLTEANALLAQLTRVAQTLPSSLDLGETLATAVSHLRQLFDFTGVAVLVHDAATGIWRAEESAGLPMPAPAQTSQLPPPLRAMVAGDGAGRGSSLAEPELGTPGRTGLWPESRSGLYAPLVARGRLVALIAVESTEPGHYGPADAELLVGLAEPLALAIDNGLWFGRLRLLGAEGERDRLARSLHDRLAQGLAYVGLELDRLSRDPAPATQLVTLRKEVSALLAEVRETLRQLRSRVSEERSLADLLETEIARFETRTGVAARVEIRPACPRLSLPVEQELWRILQDALSNVERHAQADRVTVRWACDGRRGHLLIQDDGRGFDLGEIERANSSGMTSIRERVNAIGGRLTVVSRPGAGTTIEVHVDTGEEDSGR